MTQGDVAGNREVQALYEQISKLQTKVSLSLEDAAKKQRKDKLKSKELVVKSLYYASN